tara:strand:- start:69 stop:455 length:387 start_codon:yes stop_codon:yes gene_type:complete
MLNDIDQCNTTVCDGNGFCDTKFTMTKICKCFDGFKGIDCSNVTNKTHHHNHTSPPPTPTITPQNNMDDADKTYTGFNVVAIVFISIYYLVLCFFIGKFCYKTFFTKKNRDASKKQIERPSKKQSLVF